jgi:Uma2 family endonuclease
MLIAEVLSPSTAEYDRGKKFELYKGSPSFQDYLLIEQREPKVEHWQKLETGEWFLSQSVGLNAVLEIPRYELEIPLSEIYLNVEF